MNLQNGFWKNCLKRDCNISRLWKWMFIQRDWFWKTSLVSFGFEPENVHRNYISLPWWAWEVYSQANWNPCICVIYAGVCHLLNNTFDRKTHCKDWTTLAKMIKFQSLSWDNGWGIIWEWQKIWILCMHLPLHTFTSPPPHTQLPQKGSKRKPVYLNFLENLKAFGIHGLKSHVRQTIWKYT